MRKLSLIILAICFATFAFAQTKPASKPTGFDKWEKEISAYEAKDKKDPPQPGGIVFTGSSTVLRWKTLDQDFPNLNVLNRGFGGSQIIDATHFADRIIFPYKPRMVVLRSGGNDIHAGKSAEKVFGDYKDFVAKIRSQMPDVPILYISLMPAPVRWNDRDANKKLNDLVKEYNEQHPHLLYCETYDISVGPEDKPREDLFVADRLHPNAEGYRLMVERVRPFLSPLN